MKIFLAMIAVAAAASVAASACSTSDDAAPPTTAEAGADGAAEDAADAVADDASEGGTCALPAIYGSDECNACMAMRCCGVIDACDGDPGCHTLGQCVTSCEGDPDAGGCRTDCLNAAPASSAQWKTVEACWFADYPKGCLVECT